MGTYRKMNVFKKRILRDIIENLYYDLVMAGLSTDKVQIADELLNQAIIEASRGVQTKLYQRKASEPLSMYPWTPQTDMTGVSISEGVTPVTGGYIACNAQNSADKWYLTPDYHKVNYEEI